MGYHWIQTGSGHHYLCRPDGRHTGVKMGAFDRVVAAGGPERGDGERLRRAIAEALDAVEWAEACLAQVAARAGGRGGESP